MRSVKSSGQGWQTAAMRMIVLIIAGQLFGQRAAWPQEGFQPRLEKQIAEQEKIYGRQGADVPRGYVIDRGIASYAEQLPGGFCDALGKLGSNDRWLDIGAGEGQAILDYYGTDDTAAPAPTCGRSGAKARAVALSIEDRRTDRWRERAASLGADRMRYLFGKPLRRYANDELGKFQLISDVFGGFSYTEDLSLFMEKVLSLIEVGGSFYSLLPGVRLQDGKDKLGTLYLTELESAGGSPEKVCSWLKKTACAQVTCESKSDWKRPTEVIHIQKVCSEVSVPRMKLAEFEAGYPPTRRFQLVQ